ncbi:S8 family serine peptidase [Methanogenium marinum]|uniref:S8 family serine peptidase n=1 Tax=Methanogenium marinum TaxID=348610 RepID=A0A9Q4PYZ2_9EURY|nr:S8 family serine peptidase [Methanogenium marinum]MDE4909012.1 S8 family serine peptidase [Methanogenium marinum]
MSFALLVLIASASAAQFDGDGTGEYVIVDPPEEGGGERIPVFLVMSDQPTGTMSVQTMKTTAVSQQEMAMNSLAGIDSYAAETAQSFWIVNAIRVEAYPSDLDRLASLPGVDHIERDFIVTVTDPVVETMNEVSPDYIEDSTEETGVVWSADYINAPSVWDTGNLGAGVSISIVDTGIDGDHPAFGDRIVAWADFVNGNNETPYDDNGHGSHCAGISAGGAVETTYYNGDLIDVTLGVAPGANLMGAKVLNSAGSGYNSDILKGVEWSVDNGADIISMSLGSFVGPWEDDFSDEEIVGTLGGNSSVDVVIETASSYNVSWEPQFIVGAVYADSSAIDEIISGGNLTFAVTDANGDTATGSAIDWLGFDTPSNIYYFKAPYADNAGAWRGDWKATLTNNVNESVDIEKIRIAVCYQSNGQDAFSLALNNLVEQGITVVVSAGNDGEYGLGTIGTPGTAEDVITVGATEYMMDYLATFSSMGPVDSDDPYVKPDVVAPGVGIISSYMDGGYAILDGTSMSTPAVAGAAALMLAGNSSLSPDEIKDALMSSAVHIDENGAVHDTMVMNNAYGAGRVSAYEAVNVTGGLGNTPIGDGVVYELFGGAVSEGYDVYGDVLPVTAVAWNVTGGVPMAGEEIEFSVRRNSYGLPYDYVNKTVDTDSSGNALTTMDLSGYEDETSLMLRIAWNDHVINEYHFKTVPSEHSVGDFVYRNGWYRAAPNDTVLIKYPLLNPIGTPYTDAVVLTLNNSGSDVYTETISPVAGVVATELNLSAIPGAADEYGYNSIYLDDVNVGSLNVNSEDYDYYELMISPEKSICSPGSSIDISAVITSGHYGNSASTTATATVVTFTETLVNSLTTEERNLLLGEEITSLAELEAEIQGMDENEYSENFAMNSGIGVYHLTMPEDAYLALVYVTTPLTPYSYESAALVYGELTPWIQHSTTESYFEIPYSELTYLSRTSSEWSATWDQEEYEVVPADEASLGFTVYTYALDEATNSYVGEPASDRTVYLYTRDGALSATTGTDGTCIFTLTPGETDDAGYEYLAVTGGVDIYGNIYDRASPLYPESGSRILADLIAFEPVVPSYHSYLYADTVSRTISVVADNDTRTITIASNGPDDESIQEKGIFTFDKLGAYFSSSGTFDASTVAFDGTYSKSVEVPEKGYYTAEFNLLNPVEGNLQYSGTTFTDTSYTLTYPIMDDLLLGQSVPVTFTLMDHNGNPVQGAKVLFKLGAGAGYDLYSYGVYGDPREENIWTYLGEYPDPYSQVYTGSTDTNGQLILTFVAPTSAEQAYREELGSSSSVDYQVVCIYDDMLISSGYGYFMPVAGELPDFVPSVDAPDVVKINRDDSIRVDNLGLLVKNVGTADYIDSGINVQVVAEVASYKKETSFSHSVLIGETAEVLYLNVDEDAETYGIDPETTSFPQDKTVKVTVNPEPRAVEELRYDNNVYNHNLRITAPDLVTEVITPAATTQFVVTPIGVKVTNAGDVASVATTLSYYITGTPDEPPIAIAALEAGESTTIWRNGTLSTGTYEISAAVNPGHVTDYETSYTNNEDTRNLISYAEAPASIVLPQNSVFVPGTSLEIPIVVEDGADLAAYQMTFSYNASVIDVSNVVSGDVDLTGVNLQDGYVIFNGAQTSGVSGSVTIATLVIDVIGSTDDETLLTISNAAELWDINGFAVPVTVTDGSATLLLYGDANDDGVVSQADTLKVLKWVVGLDTDKPTIGTRLLQTDVTKNSHVDVGDAMFIAQYNVELRDEYFNIL